MRATRNRFGFAILVDWHSMPSAAAVAEEQRSGQRPDIVVGDRHGRSCDSIWSGAVRHAFETRDRRVVMNRPYAGGHATERWGKPETGLHAIQIEIDRALYVDEIKLEPLAGFARLAEDVAALGTALTSRT